MDIRVMLLCLALYGIPVGTSSSNPMGQCRQINSCACLYDDVSLIDLAPLSRDGGNPHFQHIRDVSTEHTFFWNPCTPFSLLPKDSTCQDVAMCMVKGNNGTEMYYDLGRQESAAFITADNTELRLVYTYSGDHLKRISEIGLRCLDISQPDKLTIQDIIQEDYRTTKYVLLLESRFACRYVPERPTPSTAIKPTHVGPCRKINSCSCRYDDGSIVDLSPLTRNDGKPEFTNNELSTRSYSWNPCKPFTFNNTECKNVAVCLIHKGMLSNQSYDLGDQGSAEFMVDVNGSLKLNYTANRGGFMRVTEITLQCLAISKFDFFIVEHVETVSNDKVLYTLTLASKHACAYAPALETTSISVCNDTTEPTFSTTSSPTSNSTSNLPDHSNISTRRYSTSTGSTNLTTTSSGVNFSPLIGSAWVIITNCWRTQEISWKVQHVEKITDIFIHVLTSEEMLIYLTKTLLCNDSINNSN